MSWTFIIALWFRVKKTREGPGRKGAKGLQMAPPIRVRSLLGEGWRFQGVEDRALARRALTVTRLVEFVEFVFDATQVVEAGGRFLQLALRLALYLAVRCVRAGAQGEQFVNVVE